MCLTVDFVPFQMPKSALLRAHLRVTVHARSLLEPMFKNGSDVLYVWTFGGFSLAEATWFATLPNDIPFHASEVGTCSVESVTDPLHDGGWVLLKPTGGNFGQGLGGPEGFEKWFVDCVTLSVRAKGMSRTIRCR